MIEAEEATAFEGYRGVSEHGKNPFECGAPYA